MAQASRKTVCTLTASGSQMKGSRRFYKGNLQRMFEDHHSQIRYEDKSEKLKRLTNKR